MLIEMRDIRKSYHQSESVETNVLASLTLNVREGEFAAIMGPSGSGKTTLMNIIGTLDPPSGGKYLLAGQDVSRLDDRGLTALRNRTIGFVFQQFNLLQRRSVLENVALPLFYAGHSRAEALSKAAIILEKLGLAHRADYMPTQLSGGQQQRVAIARALVTDPKLLLADEPTGNLDSKTSDEVMELFVSLHTMGLTLILVTHEQHIANYATRLIHIKDGGITYDGPTAAYKEAEG